MVYTPSPNEDYKYWLTIHTNVFQFQMRSCNIVYLILARYEGDEAEATYEIDIKIGGSNDFFLIKEIIPSQGESVSNSTNLQHTIDCSVLQSFWVAWHEDGNRIFVGKGLAPDDVLIELKPQQPHPLKAIALASDEDAEWSFSKLSGEIIIYFMK